MFQWISVLCLCFCLSIVSIQAHQADISSTVLMEQEDGNWLLQIKSPLTAFEYEIKQHYGEEAFATAEEFQELVLNYLKKNISIQINEGATATLQNGFVKLGHESNVIFQVTGIPNTINSVAVKNSSFADIHRNQSALLVLKKGFSKNQFILNNANQHSVNLIVQDSNFVIVSDEKISQNYSTFFPLAGLLILVSGIFAYYRNRQKNEATILVLQKPVS